MKPSVYNACVLIGVLLVSCGAGIQWGAGLGLLIGGGLVLTLTIYAAELSRRRSAVNAPRPQPESE